MTIRKGEPWGVEVPRPERLLVAHDDRELVRAICEAPEGAHSVDGGDLHRTLGSPRSDGPTMQRLPIDLLEVDTGTDRYRAVAHVVVRRRWWRGRVVFVCNVDHVGDWNVAPRAHPDDGRFDVVDVAAGMRWRDRWEARRRLPLGTHVPHPDISVRRATEWTWSDPAGARVYVDGADVGRHTSMTVRILPDAASVLV